jgi:hypothetical protein
MEQDHRRQQAIGGVANSVIRRQPHALELRFVPEADSRTQQISPRRVQGAHSGNPAARNASIKGVASAGTQPIAAHCPLLLKLGWRASTRSDAVFASSMRPSFTSDAANIMCEILKPSLLRIARRTAVVASS